LCTPVLRRVAVFLAVLAASPWFSACSSDPFAVSGEPLCRQRDNLISCVNRDEYRQEQTIRWEVRSARTDTVFFDTCSTTLSRDRGPDIGFEDDYRPQTFCGSGADRSTVAANMVAMLPGETFSGETVLGALHPQGRYRMNLWIVDETGRRLSEGPYFTPPFVVLPSVGQ